MEKLGDYTIPSDNRELQPSPVKITFKVIIPYQVITGNYNNTGDITVYIAIIPYQVITGNYNGQSIIGHCWDIIPYQVITGNYNLFFPIPL